MDAQLMTSWAEHDDALFRVLAKASHSLCIFDEDLMMLKLEDRERIDLLKRFFATDPNNRLQIIVKNPDPLQTKCPRQMDLYTKYLHAMTVAKAPEHLSALSDSMVIADRMHALIRFHKDHARSKVILDNPVECRPYVQRFSDLLLEGGEAVVLRPLGL